MKALTRHTLPAIVVATLMLTACATRRATTTPATPRTTTRSVSPRYRYLYLEATRQKLLENHTAAFDLFRHCADIDSNAAEALYNLALYRRLLRQDSIALHDLRRATALEPDNAQYVEALASYYLETHETDSALAWLESLARLRPKRTDVLSRLVNIYSSTDRPAEAIRALDRIELLEGMMPAVSYRKFSLYKQMDRDADAYAALEALCREYPHEPSYRLAIANELLDDDRTDEALRIFDEVRRQDPTNTQLRLSELQYYRKSGADSAFQTARDSLLFDVATPSDIRVALMRDLIAEKMTDDSLGRQHIDSTFARMGIATTEDTQLLGLQAAFLATYDADNDSAFADVMDRVNTIEPSNTQALFYLIQYHGQRQHFERLEAICRRGVLTHPEELVCHYYLGVALYQQDKRAEALDAFRNGIVQKTDESRPQMVADLYSICGDVLHEMGLKEESYAAYDSCLTYQDDNVACLNNYAYYLSLENEQLDRAEEMSYRTIRLQPDNKTYLDTYAWILFMKGRYAEAQHYIDRVCPPDSADSVLLADDEVSGVVLEHAGDIAANNGDIAQALRFWHLAQEAGGTGLTAALPKKIKLKKYIEQ